MGRKEKKMIDIQISPELSYVLWCVVTAFEFFLFAAWVLFLRKAIADRSGKLWYATCVFFILIVVYNIIFRMGHVSAWYNILAQLKGW